MHISILRLGVFWGHAPPPPSENFFIMRSLLSNFQAKAMLLGGHADVRVLHAWISTFPAYRAVQDWFQVPNHLLVLQMRVVRLIVYCEWKLLEGRLRDPFVPFACSRLTSFNMWHISPGYQANACAGLAWTSNEHWC